MDEWMKSWCPRDVHHFYPVAACTSWHHAGTQTQEEHSLVNLKETCCSVGLLPPYGEGRFSESQSASQSQKKQDFQIVFSLGFHNSLWVQITKNQVHDHYHHRSRLSTEQKEQSSHPCRSTHVQSLSSWVGNSEGDPFMVSAPASFLASSPSPALNQLPFRSLSRKLHLPDWLSPCTQHPWDGPSSQAYVQEISPCRDHWHIV